MMRRLPFLIAALLLALAASASVPGMARIRHLVSQPAPPPQQISGVVVREDGTAVERATVLVAHITWDAALREELAAYRATTDREGRFSMQFPPQAIKLGRIWVTALAPGLAAASESAAPDDRQLRFVLRPETRLPVRIMNEAGAGVAGVRLFVWQGVSSATPRREGGLPHSNTIVYGEEVSSHIAPPSDVRGHTEIRHLPRGGRVCVMVRDTSWVQAWPPAGITQPSVSLAVASVSPEHTIRVWAAASVHGELVTETGRPLSGYRVCLSPKEGGTAPPDIVTTDAQGRFHIGGLPGGGNYVQVYGPPGPDFARPKLPDLHLAPGEQVTGHRIICPKGSLITGRLLDSDSGKPIVGVSVGLGELEGDCLVISHSHTSAADGVFSLRVRAREWTVTFIAPRGYDAFCQRPPAGYGAWPRIRTENGKDYHLGDIPLVLAPWRVIRGQVLNPDGTAAARATVYYRRGVWDVQTLAWTPHATAGADGSFAIPDIPRGGVYLLRASKGELSTAKDIPVDLSREPEPQTLRLKRRPLASIGGRVVDERGRPVEGAVVDVEFPLARKKPPAAPYTDAHGRFRVDVWPDEEYVVYIESEDFGLGQSGVVRPGPSSRVELPGIVLRGRDSYLVLTLSVRGGEPLRNARVQIKSLAESPEPLTTARRTDGYGRLVLAGIRAGEYHLRLSAPHVRLKAEGHFTAHGFYSVELH